MIGEGVAAWHAIDWLLLVERELLAFAVFWFCIGLIDELAVDLVWLGFRLTGRSRTLRLPVGYGAEPLSGPAAVLLPAFGEVKVIGITIAHMLETWPQRELTVYVGCYRNDPATLNAAIQAIGDDRRVRLVSLAAKGPTTKADCLNRLYRALCADEARRGVNYASVLMHDAEDMVHPCALQAIDAALVLRDFVQLPVRPEPQDQSRWIAGHYSDEFTENHAKGMVVRSALGAAIPAAGVGCGFARQALAALAARRHLAGETGPFAPDCLTEDYELGLELSRQGRGSAFLRLRDDSGQLVATRSYFPHRLEAAVRQKTRWVHGIAFQGWERMGWTLNPVDIWMALRDRRGPLVALVMASAYLLLVLDAVLLLLHWQGYAKALELSSPLRLMLLASFFGFAWRAAIRAIFTGREYGWREGLFSLLRIPVGNVITIMAGRRALVAYFRSLQDGRVTWDKTVHEAHPAFAVSMRKAKA